MEEKIRNLISELEAEKVIVTKDWESGYNNGLTKSIELIVHRLIYGEYEE